jgi:hypothetical protein
MYDSQIEMGFIRKDNAGTDGVLEEKLKYYPLRDTVILIRLLKALTVSHLELL